MPKYSQAARARLATAGRSATRMRDSLPRRLPDLPTLSREAKWRLSILEYAKTHSVSATCRRFGIARTTYYYWRKRYDPRNLRTLETRPSKPKKVRHPTWVPEQATAVKRLRQEHPRWGKDKLAVLLAGEGVELSVSMVGRILSDLKRRGLLREPRAARGIARHSRHKRPYAVRKPKEYEAEAPGDLVQVDTMQVRPLPGVVRYHFTATDVVSRWGVVAVRGCATSGTARDFLGEVIERTPFGIGAVQVDGGSEFMAEFEAACQERSIPLYVLPPRSPELNGHVERANRTHRQEFWECYDGELELPELREALLGWERVYNQVRPHQALAYKTPAQYLAEHQTVA